MKRIPVRAKLLAPVALRRDRQSERSESMHSIPGTTVRGAIAAVYLQFRGEPDETFHRLFLDEDSCRFGPLDPGPIIAPLTGIACKREGLRHTFVDQLWYRIAQHSLDGHIPDTLDTTLWRQCRVCHNDLKGFEGFLDVTDDRVVASPPVDTQVAAHVGIDRYTGTAADGIFYTLESLLPLRHGAGLRGWLMADEQALADLRLLLQETEGLISVGHHRTRGYGDIRLCLDAEDVDSGLGEVSCWNDWNERLHRFLAEWSVTGLDSADFFFSLSFPSGAILVDRFLRYTHDPAAMVPWLPPMPSIREAFPQQERAALNREETGKGHWVTAMTRQEPLRGWNAAHGLPRQDEWAVARGAVYVYRFRGKATQRDALCGKLQELAANGIGLRRNEGFGEVAISDEIHSMFCHQSKQGMQ